MDITVLFNTNYSGSVKISVAEASNPSAEVDSYTYTSPLSSSHTFTGRDKVTHIVTFIALPSTILIPAFYITPKETNYQVKDPIYFKIGDGGTDTPVAGATSYRNTNSDLIDWDYWVERRGVGTLVDNASLAYKDITKVATDPDYGFDLALAGDEFNDGETFIIHFIPKAIITDANDSVVGKWFDGTTNITADTSYISDHLKKLLLLRKSGGSLTYTLPAGTAMPIGYALAFQTCGDDADYVIARTGTDVIEYGGGNITEVHLLKNQFLILIWNGTNWEIVMLLKDSFAAYTVSDNPDDNNSSKLASTVATSTLSGRIKILGSGIFNIGDIPGRTNTYTVVHNLHISGSYIVLGSFKSNSSNPDRDNTITWAFYNALADSFQISVEELFSEVQNIDFCWMVVKV